MLSCVAALILLVLCRSLAVPGSARADGDPPATS